MPTYITAFSLVVVVTTGAWGIALYISVAPPINRSLALLN